MKKIIFIISILFASIVCTAQEWELKWDADTYFIGGTSEYLPFWARTGHNGIIPHSSSALLAGGADLAYKANNGIYFETGTHLVGSLESKNPIHQSRINGIIDRLYISGGWKMLHLDLGLKPRKIELSDLSITGGNSVITGNARNIPGINAWSDWIYFEKRHLIGIKGNLAHYKLNDQRYIQQAMIHNKSMAVKLGWMDVIELEAGLDHWAQWGGISPILGKRPSSFKDYLRIMLGKRGGKDATLSDQVNALGNHLGREYIRINYNGYLHNITFQYDMLYDGGNNIIQTQTFPDGIWSLNLSCNKAGLITDIIYEFIHTTWQSGDTHDRPATEEEMTKDYGKYVYWQDPNHYFYQRIVLGGRDNYYNNDEYCSGWTYFGRTIGIPLILPAAPNQEGYTMGIINNRIRGHHLGIKGFISDIPYTFKATYSSNWGTFKSKEESIFYKKPWQVSLALELKFSNVIKKAPISLEVGTYGDLGELYQNSVGLTLKLSYNSIKNITLQ